MKKSISLRPELIQIADFQIIKGQVESPFEFDESKVDGHTFNARFLLGLKLEEKLVKADFEVNIKTTSRGEETQEEAKGHFHFVFIYEVANLEELVELTEDQRFEVSSSLGNALASISYSTSRGILMTRFNGTALSNFILPVINPNDLLEN